MRPGYAPLPSREQCFRTDLPSLIQHKTQKSEPDLCKHFPPPRRPMVRRLGDAVSGLLFTPTATSVPFGEYREATAEDLASEGLRCYGVSDGERELVGEVAFRVY